MKKMTKRDRAAVMRVGRRVFGLDNPYGVLAFGIDRRMTNGRVLAEHALAAYVVCKHPSPAHRVRALRFGGKVIHPDIVATGTVPRAHDGGAKPPFSGIYAGAPISVRGRIAQYGGVACVLGDGGSPTHLLTAGHLFPTDQPKVSVLGGVRGGAPTVIGWLSVNLLDSPYTSMEHPIDAALVELTNDGARIARQSSDGPSIGDYVPSDQALGIDVQTFMPTAHDYSRVTPTLDGPLDAQMQSPARGTYFVRDAIATRAVITNPGDSGTILSTSGASRSAVGLCVGQFGALSIFEPIGRALSILQRETGLTLAFA